MGDFILFKKAIDVIKLKEHLTTVSRSFGYGGGSGLKKLVSIKASINWGLPDKLKGAFPGLVYVDRPLIIDQKILDPYWLAGFTAGEGCFYISISSKANTGVQVQLVFSLTQHNRDEALMNSLISYFNCGQIKKSKYSWLTFNVTSFSDINEKIIPFFNKYNVLGIKSQDFVDWCKVVELMNNKVHLTTVSRSFGYGGGSGLEEIRKLKGGMNSGRSFLLPVSNQSILNKAKLPEGKRSYHLDHGAYPPRNVILDARYSTRGFSFTLDNSKDWNYLVKCVSECINYSPKLTESFKLFFFLDTNQIVEVIGVPTMPVYDITFTPCLTTNSEQYIEYIRDIVNYKFIECSQSAVYSFTGTGQLGVVLNKD